MSTPERQWLAILLRVIHACRRIMVKSSSFVIFNVISSELKGNCPPYFYCVLPLGGVPQKSEGGHENFSTGALRRLFMAPLHPAPVRATIICCKLRGTQGYEIQITTKMHHFMAKMLKKFWGGGTAPLPMGRGHILPILHPFGAFGTSLQTLSAFRPL